MKNIIIERYNTFGSAGHAYDYEPKTLEDMKIFYEESKLQSSR